MNKMTKSEMIEKMQRARNWHKNDSGGSGMIVDIGLFDEVLAELKNCVVLNKEEAEISLNALDLVCFFIQQKPPEEKDLYDTTARTNIAIDIARQLQEILK